MAEAVDLINSTEKCIVLMSGSIGEDLVSAIQQNPKVFDMTVFTSRVDLYAAWAARVSTQKHKIEVFDRFAQPMLNNLRTHIENANEDGEDYR